MRTSLKLLSKPRARRIWWAAVLGLATGVCSVIFYTALQFGIRYILVALTGYSAPEPGGEHSMFPSPPDMKVNLLALALVPALGGLLTGLWVSALAPEAEGHGTDAVIDAFHHKGGRIRARIPVVKAVASVLTLGSGGAGGREGPMAQIGAGIGSMLADWRKMPDHERRMLVCAGVGAGVGSIFKAPLAGALFACEVLYSSEEFEHSALIPSAVASILAYAVFASFFGFGPIFTTSQPAFHNPQVLIPYTVLAFACALSGWLYIHTLYGLNALFKRLPGPGFLRPALGGLCTGLVGVVFPASLSTGYGFIQQAIDLKLTLGFLVLLVFTKIVTTSCTIGSGGSGGVFGPAMVIGAATGGAVGIWARGIWPDAGPERFVILGMAAFFAGSARVPISTILMVSELTGAYQMLVPSSWVCALTFFLMRGQQLYRCQLPHPAVSPAHQGDLVAEVLNNIQIRGYVAHPVCLTEGSDWEQVRAVLVASGFTNYPVIDGGGRLLGVVSSKQLLRLEQDWQQGVVEALTLPEDATLLDASRLLNTHPIRMAVILDRHAKVTGIFTRQDLIDAYHGTLAGWSGELEAPRESAAR